MEVERLTRFPTIFSLIIHFLCEIFVREVEQLRRENASKQNLEKGGN
jgi:hypothetical protein